ncbi:MAG: GAF domain-containing protein [bacterium]
MILQGKEFEGDFLPYLLSLTARPSTSLDGLLKFILERALAVTSTDVGGGIFVIETSRQKHVLVASALRGEYADTSANLLKSWKQNPCSPAFITLQSGKPYRIDDYQQTPVHFPLLPGGRSSLWVPLIEGTRIIGLLHMESSQPNYYCEARLCRLQNLVANTVPAIHRFLLRQQMIQVGARLDIIGVSALFWSWSAKSGLQQHTQEVQCLSLGNVAAAKS